MRLDQALVELGLVESRSKAQALILAGHVLIDTLKIEKAGHQVKQEDFHKINLKSELHPWVSRGGMKLAHAIDEFKIACQGKVAADIGASTGGFTDVLLYHGASKVYAVDVGHGQIAWKLRTDNRVILKEKTNARYLTQSDFEEELDIIVCDASFIGLKLVLNSVLDCLKKGGIVIALIKPQFEVGKENVGKGGVVKDPDLHGQVCEDIKHWFENEKGFDVQAITPSPILGPMGNKEFLIYARKRSQIV